MPSNHLAGGTLRLTFGMIAALPVVLHACADVLIVAKDLLGRAAATGQLTEADVQLNRAKFASADAGCKRLAALVSRGHLLLQSWRLVADTR